MPPKKGKPAAAAPSRKAEKRREKELRAQNAAIQMFSNFYIAQYPGGRWEELWVALSKQTRHCAMLNRFADPSVSLKVLGVQDGHAEQYRPDMLMNAFIRVNNGTAEAQSNEVTNENKDDDDVEEEEQLVDAEGEFDFGDPDLEGDEIVEIGGTTLTSTVTAENSATGENAAASGATDSVFCDFANSLKKEIIETEKVDAVVDEEVGASAATTAEGSGEKKTAPVAEATTATTSKKKKEKQPTQGEYV